MADLVTGPSLDRGHEALRQDILATVAEIGQANDDAQGSLYVIDVLFDMIIGLSEQVDDLTARLAALEAAG